MNSMRGLMLNFQSIYIPNDSCGVHWITFTRFTERFTHRFTFNFRFISIFSSSHSLCMPKFFVRKIMMCSDETKTKHKKRWIELNCTAFHKVKPHLYKQWEIVMEKWHKKSQNMHCKLPLNHIQNKIKWNYTEYAASVFVIIINLYEIWPYHAVFTDCYCFHVSLLSFSVSVSVSIWLSHFYI